MINIDMTQFNKTMNEAIEYSRGFLAGAESNVIIFNQQLAEVIKEAFYKYLDSTARLDPDRLHHMYEWGQVGVDKARLFKIEAFSGKQSIRFVTEFMQSTSVSPTANEPFVNKAEVMESGTTVTVSPSSGGVLAFTGDDGDMVFTTEDVTITNPGGNVAGQFGAVARDFFINYLDQALLKELIKDMETPNEFTQGWGKGMNYSKGMKQGQRYMTVKGGVA
ncbi:MAG: hypothetical protein VW551_04900 [Euryarchaeota archaeon]